MQLAAGAHAARFRLVVEATSVRGVHRCGQAGGEVVDGAAEQRRRLAAEHGPGLVIGQRDAPVHVDQQHGIGRGLHDAPEAFVGGTPLAHVEAHAAERARAG